MHGDVPAQPEAHRSHLEVDASTLFMLSTSGLHLPPILFICPTALAVCRPGYAGPACAACARGSFSPGGNSSVPTPQACVTCPVNSTTLGTNSTGPAACSGAHHEGLAAASQATLIAGFRAAKMVPCC